MRPGWFYPSEYLSQGRRRLGLAQDVMHLASSRLYLMRIGPRITRRTLQDDGLGRTKQGVTRLRLPTIKIRMEMQHIHFRPWNAFTIQASGYPSCLTTDAGGGGSGSDDTSVTLLRGMN